MNAHQHVHHQHVHRQHVHHQHIHRHRRLAGLAAAVLVPLVGLVAGCGLGSNAVEGLGDAQARWEEAAVADYRFEVIQLCQCDPDSIGPFEVTVRDGEVVEVTHQGEPPSDRAPEQLFTVERLFAQIEAWRDDDMLTATFDPEYGVPTEIRADQDVDTDDDETTVTVTGFTVLDR